MRSNKDNLKHVCLDRTVPLNELISYNQYENMIALKNPVHKFNS